MQEKYDYTINELFEEALKDDSWESDPQKREMYVMGLKFELKDIN